MHTAILNRTSRILGGHLWVFSNELAGSPKALPAGGLVELQDKKGTFLGIGYANPHSLISIRILTRQKEEIGPEFFRKRILQALEYRKRFLGERDSYRAIFSEGDYLPGLIVDKFAGCLSVQILTLGMEQLTDAVIGVLDDIFKPETIVLKNDSQARILEGLNIEKKILKGSLDKLPIMNEGGMLLEVNPMAGQKTGFFLDQAENRAAFSSLVSGGTGLDLFSYTGAWSIKLAKKGSFVTAVDSSETAISQSKRNAELNDVSDRCSFVKADAFDFLKALNLERKKYDFIVLDPPAFVKSKAKLNEAVRAYREVNAASMSLLKDAGLLATSSCSYHLEKAMFMEMLRAAAKDAGKKARVVEMRSQAKDHPISLSVPETEYLKCAILEVS